MTNTEKRIEEFDKELTTKMLSLKQNKKMSHRPMTHLFRLL